MSEKTGKIFSTFVMSETTFRQIQALPNKLQNKFFIAVNRFGLYGIEPEFEGIELALWIPMHDLILSSKSNDSAWLEKQSASGRQGGAPFGNTNAKKKTTENNPETTKTTENNSKQLNNQTSLNDNDNVNLNDNDRSIDPHLNLSPEESPSDKASSGELAAHDDNPESLKAQLYRLGYPTILPDLVKDNIPETALNRKYNILDYIADYLAKTYKNKPSKERESLFVDAIRYRDKWRDLYVGYDEWQNKKLEAQAMQERKRKVNTPPQTVCPDCGEPLNLSWLRCSNGCGHYLFNEKTGKHDWQKRFKPVHGALEALLAEREKQKAGTEGTGTESQEPENIFEFRAG